MIVRRLSNMTIKQKLAAIVMLPTSIALLLTVAVFVGWEQLDSRHHLAKELDSYAGVLAEDCKAALAFSHKEDAERLLAALHCRGSIVFACVYDSQGQVFAKYQRGDLAEKIQAPWPQEDSHVFENGYLSVFRQIELDGQPIGTVYLRDCMSQVTSELKWDIAVAVLILPLGLAVAYLLSSTLQKVVSSPIRNLAEVAKQVSEQKDYSVRAVKNTDDEVGRLIEMFNEMLDKIQRRDAELVEAKGHLEQSVQERTAELSRSNEQLKRFNRLAVGRELRMVELKREVNQLLCELDKGEKYRTEQDAAKTCAPQPAAGDSPRQENERL
jgi:HAMP domain-containing protein